MLGVAEYIEYSLQYEQYAFTWEELRAYSSKTDEALKLELKRLGKKHKILNLRHGFYLILTPRYKNYKKLPLELYIDKLSDYLNKSYYIGLYSAASFFGASHQQIQKDYIITSYPSVRDIRKANIYLDITVKKNWPAGNILKKRSASGYFNIASPAFTIADLIHYQKKMGGINRFLAIIEELTSELTVKDLKELLSWYKNKTVLQKMGFLLESLQTRQAHIDILYNFLSKQELFPVSLSNDQRGRTGNIKYPWKVDVNVELESDI